MAASSKAEYLKKYLSENAEEKKKRKKRKVATAKVPKSRIVDDDIDLKQLLPENLSNTLEEDVGDYEPTVAEFIDERPERVQLLEKYRKSGAWKVMGKNDARGSDSDMSPSRRRHDSDSDQSPPRRRHDSDSDNSPPKRKRHDSDYDQSPPRQRSNKPIERSRHLEKRPSHTQKQNPGRKKSRFSDLEPSEQSSERHNSRTRQLSDRSPPRRRRHDSDQSPPRRQRHDSDQSPPRRKQRHDSDQSPPRRRQRHDSDQSPPRRRPRLDSDQSPPRKKQHHSDSDQSPPRRQRQDSDSDQSPPRRPRHDKRDPRRNVSKYRNRHDSDSDLSPPRRASDNKSASRDKEQKTLGGKRAGLSSAAEMRREAQELRKKEDDKFSQISDEKLGRGAATVFRDRKSGKKRDLDEERRQATEEGKRKAKEDEKYQKWGKGMKQAEQQSVMTMEAVHEANKPLARYRDDDDLDKMLREMERAEDPMLAFIKKKKKTEDPKKEKPRYKGPAPPPNRFGIPPGFRWDGVDRTNGFEKQVFTKMSNDRATASAAYKWSVEDM